MRFLYSFLDVMDDQGRALPTPRACQGIAPNGKTFSGVVVFPRFCSTMLKTLTLTDYPDQQLQLQMSAFLRVRRGDSVFIYRSFLKGYW